MTLVLQTRTASTLPVNVTGVLPHVVAPLSLGEIERLPIWVGRQQLPLGEWFTVSGDPAAASIVWQGQLEHVHHLAAGQQSGLTKAEGSVGDQAGAAMRGGKLEITGDAADWLGAELRGGTIVVHGSAGQHAASAYPGSRRGMNGGTVVVLGNAGEDLAVRLRRGMVAVGGTTGLYPGAQMIAGTLVLGGPCGEHPAPGMRRGTVLCLQRPAALLPSFRYACRFRPTFLPLFLRELAQLDFPLASELYTADFDRHCGDLLNRGKGEVLIPALPGE